ncbi:hypothetical protein [Roseomonas mucosa]
MSNKNTRGLDTSWCSYGKMGVEEISMGLRYAALAAHGALAYGLVLAIGYYLAPFLGFAEGVMTGLGYVLAATLGLAAAGAALSPVILAQKLGYV